MGWGLGDIPKVERAKLELADAKSGLYKLNRLENTIANIQHTEKREAMLKEFRNIDESLRVIEMHLNR